MFLFTKKYTLLIQLAIVFSSFLFSNDSYASHQYSGGLYYKCIDSTNHIYEVEYVFYRDCNQINAPTSFRIYCNSTNNCTLTSIAVLHDVVDLSIVCDTVSPCQVRYSPGIAVEKHTYRDTIVLDPVCGTWTLSSKTCCRSNAVTNLANAGATSLYFEQVIHPNTPCNESVKFGNSSAVIAKCSGLNSFNLNAVDGDGDSLYYRLVPISVDSNAIASYSTGHSMTVPLLLEAGTTFDLDSVTGQITYTSRLGVSQIGVVGVAIDEIRNGVVINTTIREIWIMSFECQNAVRLDSIVSANNFTNSVQQPLQFFTCPNQPLALKAYFSSNMFVTSDSLLYDSINSNIQQLFPNAIVQVFYPNPSSKYHIAVDITIPNSVAQSFILAFKQDGCLGLNTANYMIGINHDPIITNQSHNACDSFNWQGITYDSSGVYADTLMTAEGCDSIAKLFLTIDSLQVDTGVSIQNGNQLISNQLQLFTMTYQWGTCQNGIFTPINGANSRGYFATANGSYAVQISKRGNSCQRQSACYPIVITNQKELTPQNQWQIYPNPTKDILHVQQMKNQTATLQLFDQLGRLVQIQTIHATQRTLDMSELASGVYYLTIQSNGRVQQVKVVKQ